jgi:hypothetical protein
MGPTLRVASNIKSPTSVDLALDVFITCRHAFMTTIEIRIMPESCRLGAIPTADTGIEVKC